MIERLRKALSDRYSVERELGEGGMATVFLATDPKHDRKVAIKVLKPELAAVIGAERFVAEIRTTASLQHSHILPLFDSGEADGFLYYVMPYVEGESLRDRLDRETQLGVEEAVRIASAVASALHYAHEQGVVHRDIKPANILLHAGQPVVADFGIALAISAAGGGRLTETGMSVGTPHYMSPEQASADREVSARSDVYSLACVLYEMLTGDPPHTGPSARAVIMRILTEEPRDPAQLRASVPPHVRDAVMKAMEKLPADRFATAEDFARALEDPAYRHRSAAHTSGRASGGTDASRGSRAWLAAGTVAAVALLVGFAFGRSTSGPAEVFDVGLPFDAPMVAGGGTATSSVSIAPDGSFLVYVAEKDGGTALHYRSLTGPESREIPGTDGAYFTPQISPDGARVAFPTSEGLFVTPVEGGPVTQLSDQTDFWGGGWRDEGVLFAADLDGRFLRWVDPETGPVRDLFVGYCQMPSMLDESRVICGGGANRWAVVGDVDREPFALDTVWQRAAAGDGLNVLRGSYFRPFGDYLVYTGIDGTLMGTKFLDREELVVGRSAALVPNVRRTTYIGTGVYDISDEGTLAWVPGPNQERGPMVRRTRDGATTVAIADSVAHLRFAVSPDGERLASVVEGIRRQELRLYDLGDGSYEVLAEGLFLGQPHWADDGSHLVYGRVTLEGRQVLLHRLDSGEQPRMLLPLEPGTSVAQYLDGTRVLTAHPDRGISLVDPTQDPIVEESLWAGGSAYFARISPDERWLLWRDQTVPALLLMDMEDRSRQWTVASGRNNTWEPLWASEREVLLSHPDGRVASLPIDPDGSPPFGEMEVLFQDPRKGETPGWSFALTPEGDILHVLAPKQVGVQYVRVVPGWLDEAKRAIDEANR